MTFPFLIDSTRRTGLNPTGTHVDVACPTVRRLAECLMTLRNLDPPSQGTRGRVSETVIVYLFEGLSLALRFGFSVMPRLTLLMIPFASMEIMVGQQLTE